MSFKPTKEQQKVLGHEHTTHGRILAGPGTGKSSTVVAYMEELLKNKPAPRLKLLTFTRSTTSELAEKIAAVTGGERIRPSTIHSFAISILLANGGVGSFPQPLRIADDWENEHIVLPSLMRLMGCNKKDCKRHLQEMASMWESLDPNEESHFSEKERLKFLGIWQEHRDVLGYTLLQELPFRLHEVLEGGAELKGCDFDLLIVDEYQDLNACDLAVIKLLSEQYDCAVLGIGDDDQSIYSFRSAAPEGIRRFHEDYKDAAEYPLTVSLRCGKKIIEWANHVIQQNTDRPTDRAPLQPGKDNPQGEVALYSFKSEVQEAKGVAKLVERMMSEQEFAAAEILILLRGDYNQTFSKPIKNELEKLEIEYADPKWVDAVLSEDENRMFLALLRLAANEGDSLAWATVLTLTNGVGDTFLDHAYAHAKKKKWTFAKALLSLANTGFVGLPTAPGKKAQTAIDAVNGWLKSVSVPDEMPEDGWTEWLGNLPTIPGGLEPSDKLFELARGVESLIDDEIDLGRFLGQLYPLGRDLANAQAEGVRIMSLASSKGLTVRGTIIAGCEDGIIPREGQDRSEEARLLFVGMTRSKEVLYCTWARRRRGPTARAGRSSVQLARRPSGFFTSGPVKSEPGDGLVK